MYVNVDHSGLSIGLREKMVQQCSTKWTLLLEEMWPVYFGLLPVNTFNVFGADIPIGFMVGRSLTAALNIFAYNELVMYSTIQLLQNVKYLLKQQKFQESKDFADIKLKPVGMIYSAKDLCELNIVKYVRQFVCYISS